MLNLADSGDSSNLIHIKLFLFIILNLNPFIRLDKKARWIYNYTDIISEYS